MLLATETKSNKMNRTLQVNNLTASYKNKIILNDICFTINSDDFICLCGPNGSGKSTLLSCMANLQQKSLLLSKESQILLNQTNVNQLSPKQTATQIAYLQQSEYCTWDFSVEDFVLQGRFCHSQNGFYTEQDKQIVSENLELLKISDLTTKSIHQISGGEFQKVKLARALSQQPDFLLLDEPAANLDFTYEPKLMKLLRSITEEKNIGIILSIHNLNLASQFAKKILLLSKHKPNVKQFEFGDASQIFTAEYLNKAFNQDFKFFEHPINKSIQIY